MALELYTALGTMQSGRLTMQDEVSFRKHLRQFADGLVSVTIEVTTDHAHRSLRANRYMWAIFSAMAQQAGVSKDDIHDLMCERFLKHRVDLVDTKTGEVTSQEVPRGTSHLTPAEHAEFLDSVIQFAGEWLGLDFQRDAPDGY